MIVYHGSNSNFKSLRISKSLVKHSSSLLNEGLGIYFSFDRKVAESYGKYLYTLEINDKLLLDFRKRSVCRLYIASMAKEIYKKTKLDILYYINMNEIAERIYYGEQCICILGDEIANILDSTDSWYFSTTEKQRIEVYKMLRHMDKDKLHVYLFNYNIKNIGIIKDLNAVRIINKERLR